MNEPINRDPEDVAKAKQRVRNSILRTLAAHPNITVAMIGPHIRPFWAPWRLVLEQMIADGEVIREAATQKTDRGMRIIYNHRIASGQLL